MPDGVDVPDYSSDNNFPESFNNMFPEQARSLKAFASKYPNHFPMPAMQRTYAEIKKSIKKLLAAPFVRAEEREVLLRLESRLDALKPGFPYKESLAITYQFLHYKGFLDYREQVWSLNDDRIPNLSIHDGEQCEQLRMIFSEKLFVRLDYYSPECKLSNLENIKWDEMLDKPDEFKEQLSRVYWCSALHRDYMSRKLSGFYTLSSGHLLVPWAGPLDISDFNQSWLLPVCLLGTSFEENTSADGIRTGAAGFWDHDLFHYAGKLNQLLYGGYNDEELDKVCGWCRQLYRCQGRRPFLFEALELALFAPLHEESVNLDRWNKHFRQQQFDNSYNFKGLPARFRGVQDYQVCMAAKWLEQLPMERFSSCAFYRKAQEIDRSFITHQFTRQGGKAFPCERMINPAIAPLLIDVRENADALRRYELSPERISLLLRRYQDSEEHVVPLNQIDEKILLGLAGDDFAIEALWVLEYQKAAAERLYNPLSVACEKMKVIKPAVERCREEQLRAAKKLQDDLKAHFNTGITDSLYQYLAAGVRMQV